MTIASRMARLSLLLILRTTFLGFYESRTWYVRSDVFSVDMTWRDG